MKKISIIILFAIFFIGCSSNDYKQDSIPLSELNNIPDRVMLNIEPQYQTTNYTCATVSLGMAIVPYLRSIGNIDGHFKETADSVWHQ